MVTDLEESRPAQPSEPTGELVKPWLPEPFGNAGTWVVIKLERCEHCGDPIGFDDDLRWWHHAGDDESDAFDPPWLNCECDCTGMDGPCVAMPATASLAVEHPEGL